MLALTDQEMPELQLWRGDTDAGQSWHLLPRFVLRSPGFPFDWLTRLRFPRSTALIHAILDAQERQAALQHHFAHDIFPALCDEETAAGRDRATFHFWYRLARRIRLGQPLSPDIVAAVDEQYARHELAKWLQQWQHACADLSHLRAEGERAFALELSERRRTLRELVGEPAFQEALWLSNPSMYDTGWAYFNRHWDPARRPSKIKHIERRFYTYLQRFSAKNDTTSFFGPLNYGTLGPSGTSSLRRSPVRIRRRQVFVAYWAAAALAARIAAEPSLQPFLSPRRNPLRSRPTGHADTGGLYALSDGQRTVVELAEMLCRPLDEVLCAVTEMTGAGYLHLDLPIPPAILQPLDYLADKLRALPADGAAKDSWLAILGEFQESCRRFATADLPARHAILAALEARYAQLTGGESRRGEGRMFQDRLLLYEECLGSVEALDLGAGHGRHIANALAPIAALCASYSQSALDDLRAAAHALFDELSPEGAPIPLVHFVAAWRRRFPDTPPSPAAHRLQQRFAELVAQADTGHVCRLTGAALAPLCAPLTEPMILSPDLLLAAPDWEALQQGRYQIVLGEIHHGMQPSGWMLAFAPDREGWERDLSRCLPIPTAEIAPANLLFKRRMKTAPPEFSGPSVHVSATSQRGQGLDLGGLVVEQQNGSLQVRCADAAHALRFYPPTYGVPEALYAPFACFSYPLIRAVPVRLGAHTPRIEIDGTVYQRERWDLATADLPAPNLQEASFQLFVDLVAVQRRLGLPDQVFVRTPAEPKPVLVDFQNFFALELLAHLASQAETLSFVEMWPAPDQLWLRDDDGRYCCELRTVVSTAPDDEAVPPVPAVPPVLAAVAALACSGPERREGDRHG